MKTIARSLILFTVSTSVCLASASAQEVMLATSTYSPANLLTVDPVTGVTLNSVPISGEEALFGGLTRNGGDLYTIDTTTGAATLVIPISGPTLDQLTCFAINSTGLAYATDIGGTGLFKLNLINGHVQHLGDLNTTNFFQDLAFDSTDRLWGLMSGGGAYLIDIPTFTATFQFFTGDWKGITFGGCPGPTVYCTAGTTAAGCATALTSSGNPSATASSGFTVSCNNVDVNRNGLFFYGVTNATFVPTPWGIGGTSYKCIANPVQRMGPMDSGGTTGCTGSYTQDWNAYMANNPGAIGNPRVLGASFQIQLWMRDPPSPKSTILSNALQFDLCP